MSSVTRSEAAVPMRGRLQPWGVAVLLAVPAAALFFLLLGLRMPLPQALSALVSPKETSIDDLVIAYSIGPRFVMALLCGASLGLAGALFQSVLRNRLAEPGTIGVSAGASLAVTLASLWFPELLGWGQETVALAGGCMGSGAVFLLARRQNFSPVSLLLAGLVVGLYCGNLAALTILFNHENLTELFLWQSGSLYQSGWGGVTYLLPRLAVIWALTFFAVRPLTMFALGDAAAGSLGLNVRNGRIAILAMAVLLGCFTASAVGLIGFVGLAAPNLARMSGARTPKEQLIWSPVIGAALLWLADGITQTTGLVMRELPTGTLTALLGAAVLLVMLSRGRQPSRAPPESEAGIAFRAAGRTLVWLSMLLLAIILLALVLGRSPDGLSLTWPFDDPAGLMQWRWPRVAASVAAGGLLALAGAILQRLTSNPMASPEVLGITSGAALGLMVQTFILPSQGQLHGMAGAGIGAALVLLWLLAMNRSRTDADNRSLLVGVGLTTFCSAVMTVLLSSGHPALRGLLGWLSGSTSGVGPESALVATSALVAAAIFMPFALRWLRILPLGWETAAALGMPVAMARMILLLATALLTGAATLLVGPMSFVGLMAPHIARQLGFNSVAGHLFASTLFGAALLAASDWIGRIAIFPWEVPAGLVSALFGAPYFLWLTQKKQR